MLVLGCGKRMMGGDPAFSFLVIIERREVDDPARAPAVFSMSLLVTQLDA